MDEEPINMHVAEPLLKEIMTRERNRRIVNSKIINVEAEAPEEEEEAIMNKRTRSNISATTIKGMSISIMNAIVDHKVE